MMNDDFFSALTQEVREEVIENYVHERRLLEEQIHYVKELAGLAKTAWDSLLKRFARMCDLLVEPNFIDGFRDLTGLEAPAFDKIETGQPGYRKEVRLIKVRALTNRGKFKKLLNESYRRLFVWNEKYREAYQELQEECKAVGYNVKKFEDNHDLLTIIRFLKDMDTEVIKRKHFLGDNFTPEEMGSVETNLRFKPVRMENFGLIRPLKLPTPKAIQDQLNDLADCVFGECKWDMKTFVQ